MHVPINCPCYILFYQQEQTKGVVNTEISLDGYKSLLPCKSATVLCNGSGFWWFFQISTQRWHHILPNNPVSWGLFAQQFHLSQKFLDVV